MTIHTSHPFADPDPIPGRQLRGRLGGRVTIWAAGTLAGSPQPAGLTVSSMMVAGGDVWRAFALLDPDSDFAAALVEQGRAAISLLQADDRHAAEVFAGVTPSPGGPFRAASFVDTEWGPRLDHALTWAGVSLEDSRAVGWSLEVTCTIDHLEVSDEPQPLHHLRGRYRVLD